MTTNDSGRPGNREVVDYWASTRDGYAYGYLPYDHAAVPNNNDDAQDDAQTLAPAAHPPDDPGLDSDQLVWLVVVAYGEGEGMVKAAALDQSRAEHECAVRNALYAAKYGDRNRFIVESIILLGARVEEIE